MRKFTYIATPLLFMSPIGISAADKEPLEIPTSPSGSPAPMRVSKPYPFLVAPYAKREVRLIERKLEQKAQIVELILGGSGDFAAELIKANEANQPAKVRQLDAAETAKLTSRILAALERHHGLKMLNTLKVLTDHKDLIWISKRDDSDDLIATVLILDALRSMHQIQEAEQDSGGNALEPPSHPSTAPSKARATP